MAHIEYTGARSRFNFDLHTCCLAVAASLKDRLIECYNDTMQQWNLQKAKRVYIFSPTFSLGKRIQAVLINLNLEHAYREALAELGLDLEELYRLEPEQASTAHGTWMTSYTESLATLDIPCWGYGIRQSAVNYSAPPLSNADDVYRMPINPREIKRFDIDQTIRFGGKVHKTKTDTPFERSQWLGGEKVKALSYDTHQPGYNTFSTVCLRQWSAVPIYEMNTEVCSESQAAVNLKQVKSVEPITSSFFPFQSIKTQQKMELFIKQRYFYCASSIKDIVRRFKRNQRDGFASFPKMVSIQLTEPGSGIAIIELLRILIDEYELSFQQAWLLVTHSVTYMSTSYTEP